MNPSRTGIIVATIPGLLALGLFYSLAMHMYYSLGKWPTGIGERGFPPALLAHVNLATAYFWGAFTLSAFILPVAILVCLLVRRWRHFASYFALSALAFLLAMLLMQFAPTQFLEWWMD